MQLRMLKSFEMLSHSIYMLVFQSTCGNVYVFEIVIFFVYFGGGAHFKEILFLITFRVCALLVCAHKLGDNAKWYL